MTHDEAVELLGAYAIGATDASEGEQVAQHVRTCRSCSEEVEQLRSAQDYLTLLSEEREPPPELRIRLMNLVEHDRLEWERQQSVAGAAQLARGRAWWARVPKLVYSLGAAVVVAAVVLVVVLINRNSVTVTTYRGGAVAQVVHGIHVGNATGVVGVRSDRSTDVLLKNMPVLPASLAYELWLIPAQGAPISLGGFEAGADHTFHERYARDAKDFGAVAVTIERAPGNWPTPSLRDLTLEVKLSA